MTRTSTVLVRDESDALELAFLQHAQKFHLDVRRQIANLIEEDVPPSASSKRPWRRATAPVKAPFSWPEQLAFDERRRQGRAVDAHQRSRVSAAPLVQRPGKQLLAGTGGPNSSTLEFVGATCDSRARASRNEASLRRRCRRSRECSLDLFLEVAVVGFEPGVELLDHRDVGAQDGLVPLALQLPPPESPTAAARVRRAPAPSGAVPRRRPRPARRSPVRPRRRARQESSRDRSFASTRGS